MARLHSHVIGGAGLLAAARDSRVASDDLSYAIPEVAIGIPLTWAGLPWPAREIGLPRTRDLVMTGRRLDAAEAEAWATVVRVVPAAELDTAVEALVADLLAQPPAALALTVDALRALGRAVSARRWRGRTPTCCAGPRRARRPLTSGRAAAPFRAGRRRLRAPIGLSGAPRGDHSGPATQRLRGRALRCPRTRTTGTVGALPHASRRRG